MMNTTRQQHILHAFIAGCVMACTGLVAAAESVGAPEPGAAPQNRAGDYPTLFVDAARSNHSPATGLMQEWPEGGPPLRWEIYGLGKGNGTPVVADGVVYTTGSLDRKHILRASALATGEELWQVEIGNPYHSTPTISGDAIVIGATHHVQCLSRSDGSLRWTLDVMQHFQLGNNVQELWDQRSNKGHATPLVVDGVIYAFPALRTMQALAIDLKTGEPVWTRADLELARYTPGYASPLLIEVDGTALIVACVGEELVALRPETGATMYIVRVTNEPPKKRMYPQNNTPIWHDGLLVWQPGYNKREAAPTRAWRPEQGGTVWTQVWQGCDIFVKHEGSIAVDGKLYGTARGLSRQGAVFTDNPDLYVQGVPLAELPEGWRQRLSQIGTFGGFPPHGRQASEDFLGRTVDEWRADPLMSANALACVDLATGKLLGLRFGPPLQSHCGHIHLYADGRLYMMTSGTAAKELHLIEPGPAMRLCGRLPIPERSQPAVKNGEGIFSSPVIADTALLLREHDRMLAFDIARKNDGAGSDATHLEEE